MAEHVPVTSRVHRSIATPILFAMAAVVAACGGGSSGGSLPPPQELINGIAVPPAPSAALNDSSLSGVDSNSNGIRDDVDRRLATEFGASTTAYAIAKEHASRLQSALIAPSATSKRAYVDYSRCVSDLSLLSRLGKQTEATLNTAERQAAYRALMTNVFVNREGC